MSAQARFMSEPTLSAVKEVFSTVRVAGFPGISVSDRKDPVFFDKPIGADDQQSPLATSKPLLESPVSCTCGSVRPNPQKNRPTLLPGLQLLHTQCFLRRSVKSDDGVILPQKFIEQAFAADRRLYQVMARL